MTERVAKWQPVSDIDCPFESILYSFHRDQLLVVRLIGFRTLELHFSGVVGLRFEQECPGFDFLELPLPMLSSSQTFPLLLVQESEWLKRFTGIYGNLSHFALVSSDHLVQLLARPNVEARWE
jgi:hypothetical protein